MDKQKLQQLIAELHEELKGADSADESSKELLRQAAADIDDAVGAGEVSPERHATFRDQLERSAVDFEADHPRVAGIVENIIDTLGKLGI